MDLDLHFRDDLDEAKVEGRCRALADFNDACPFASDPGELVPHRTGRLRLTLESFHDDGTMLRPAGTFIEIRRGTAYGRYGSDSTLHERMASVSVRAQEPTVRCAVSRERHTNAKKPCGRSAPREEDFRGLR